jgi:predicted Zn-dependent protease with MMP-like domain
MEALEVNHSNELTGLKDVINKRIKEKQQNVALRELPTDLQAIGNNLVILIDAPEIDYKLGDLNLAKPEQFEIKSSYATVVSVGTSVKDLFSIGERVYLRRFSTVGSDFLHKGTHYDVVDFADVLVKFRVN